MIKKKKFKSVGHTSPFDIPSNKISKVKLSRIIRSEYASKIIEINNIVNRVLQIVTHTYSFLKLFMINYYANYKCLPEINKNFVMMIMKTVSESSRKAGNFKDQNRDMKNQLEFFYEKHYKHLVVESDKLKYDNLTQMLDYECTNIVTAYYNHIKNHFYTFMCRYVNIITDSKNIILKIRKNCEVLGIPHKEYVNRFRSAISVLKSDIYNSTDKCHDCLNKYKKHIRQQIFNGLNIKHLLYGDIVTQVKSDPFKLLLPLLKMSLVGEKLTRESLKEKDKDKLFNVINCFPIRKSCIPKYVKIDTVMLIQIFVDKDKRFYQSNITDQKESLWKKYFKLGKGTFKKTNYCFGGSILTDGYVANICFDLEDNTSNTSTQIYEDMKDNSIINRSIKDLKMDRYVTDLSKEETSELIDKVFIGIDPGWSDIIYCTNGNTKLIEKENGKTVNKTDTFRFSRQQRRKETKIKHYRDILENDKKETIINGASVKEIETYLSALNSNSCSCYCETYIKIKNMVNHALIEYYQKEIHRQIRWYSYLNKNRSDSNMVNRFREKFGSPNDTVILMGDFGSNHTLKGSETVKGKSVRKLFKNAGYKLYLVDEYNTSKYMYQTGEELEKFRKRESPKPYKKNIQLVHGLLRIKSETSNSCNNNEEFNKTTLINRDLNGSLNIRLKGMSIIKGQRIPSYLERTIKKTNEEDGGNKIIIVKKIPKKIEVKKNDKKVKVKRIVPVDLID